MAATRIVDMLAHGKPVIRASVTVSGRLDLASLDRVAQPFKCRTCNFPQGIDASDVIFHRTLDLSGSHISGHTTFEGATFEGPVFFVAAPRPAVFQGPVDFSLAVFDDLVAFDSATFGGAATFNLARFRSNASFANTKFRDVSFSGASLAVGGVFEKTRFCAASFGRAVVGETDFRGATFGRPADFGSAAFRGSADFSQAIFKAGAVFNYAQFASGARFIGTVFTSTNATRAALFDQAGSGGDLDFSFAEFLRGAEPTCSRAPNPTASERHPGAADFSLFKLVNAGVLTLRGVDLPDGPSIAMNEISAKSLVMDVAATAHIAEGSDDATKTNRRNVLRLIEASAKARDDIASANSAVYERHVLQSRGYSGWRRVVDFVYRWIAGYFVRPLYPLVALVVVAFLLALLRLVVGVVSRGRVQPASRTSTWRPPSLRGRRAALRRGWTYAAHFLDHFLDSLGSVLPGRGGGREKQGIGRRLEVALYRVLVACALIGLANSNPTLRQLVDSLL